MSSRSNSEAQEYEAARTVYAFCLAVEQSDARALEQLRESQSDDGQWQAIAEQAICALVESTRTQTRHCGVNASTFFKSAIQALLSLEALGAPPGGLNRFRPPAAS